MGEDSSETPVSPVTLNIDTERWPVGLVIRHRTASVMTLHEADSSETLSPRLRSWRCDDCTHANVNLEPNEGDRQGMAHSIQLGHNVSFWWSDEPEPPPYVPEPEPMDIHTWFGLTYASYLVLNRSLLQSMPDEWQHQFTALLDQMRRHFHHLDHPSYDVRVRGENGRYVKDPIPHYSRGRTFIEGTS